MARPRSENPRGTVIKFRVTAGEKAALEALAEAAGVGVSDFLRSCVLGGEAVQVGPTVAQISEARRTVGSASAEAVRAAAGVGRGAVPGFRCPFGPSRCSFVAPSAKARCPVHGRTVVAR